MTDSNTTKHLYQPTSPNLWQGRVDHEDGEAGRRFHQTVKVINADRASNDQPGMVILGFCCDQGVLRNKGRIGAARAPDLIRKALANTAWHLNNPSPLYDGGNILCRDHDLEASQKELADHIYTALEQQSKVLIFGGGHETAWGSFQGLARHLHNKVKTPKIGIINFDAHFDLRSYSKDNNHYPGSSGTPFRQIADHCQLLGWPFQYACLGVSRASNTQALFNCAQQLQVFYREDHQLVTQQLDKRTTELLQFIDGCDYLYLTIDMDVFPAAAAPGVSAPAARGVSVEIIESLIQPILNAENSAGENKLLLADLTEYNPNFDIDNQTARLAARLAWQISHSMLD
ncbi:formimidoylglutamase [Psychromonas aquimarina]|uniref:formimidoylglutamase n=1 Tax=Psychromonas aquimarina TaxID=444919 RepID=UPI000429E8B2|nr:formimidoylglutamase [Psychromonas aquimarina]